jgi:serralysin
MPSAPLARVVQRSASVSPSGDQRIDALLCGTKWAGPVSFGAPAARSDYEPDYPEPLNGFRTLNAEQLATATATLTASSPAAPGHGAFSVAGFTRLATSFARTGDADIRICNTRDADTAYTYYPSDVATGGDVFLGGAGSSPRTGNYHGYALIHELGHALGLKHGNETDLFGALPRPSDSMEYSVMTYRSYVGADARAVYNEDWGFAQTYMMYDIAALQHLYGADFTANAGDTSYSWNPSTGATRVDGAVALAPGANRIFATIWDGGGIDTYDLSAYASNLDIDLAPGEASTFSAAQRARLGDQHFARGNIFNALLHENDPRSLIENAVGGTGNDTIDGNTAANRLSGNAGNDRLSGREASDLLDGGRGRDVLTGGPGRDVLIGGRDADVFRFTSVEESTSAAADILRGAGAVPAFDGAGAAAGDRIDLSAIDAIESRAGDQDFQLGASHALGRLWLAEQGTSTMVLGNVVGGLAPDLRIVIEDGATRAAAYGEADFLLA